MAPAISIEDRLNVLLQNLAWAGMYDSRREAAIFSQQIEMVVADTFPIPSAKDTITLSNIIEKRGELRARLYEENIARYESRFERRISDIKSYTFLAYIGNLTDRNNTLDIEKMPILN